MRNNMTDQFCYVPTGEVRPPKKGEWFELNGLIQEYGEFLESWKWNSRRPIYRRVPFAVVLGLVEACDVASATCSPYGVCKIDSALAAAREAGIGGANG